MILICTMHVIVMHFLTTADVKGRVLSQTPTKYYVDFSEDLKKNHWVLDGGRNGKLLVNKSECVEKK
jgi:hypothetical protein